MSPRMHPAVSLLVEAVTQRLQAPGTPPSAVRGALLEALESTPPPEDRLSRWVSSVTWSTCKILCRRMGVFMPDLPSIAGNDTIQRDWSAEIVEALLDDIDAELATVLRHLEVADARIPQIAVLLEQPPQRIRVKARQGRHAIHAALLHLADQTSSPTTDQGDPG